MTICRGTNPTLTFNFPFELALSNCDIAFAQKGFIIISKSLNDCSINGKTLSISLSQRETMLLNPGTVTIQFRICRNNKFLNSNCITAGVTDVINGVIMSREDETIGLFDGNDRLIVTYLDSGLDVTTNYTDTTYRTNPKSGYSVMNVFDKTRELVLPNNIVAIGNNALRGCDQITRIVIPKTVETIGLKSFQNCSLLADITFNGTIAEWNAITKGNYWNYETGNYTIHCVNGDLDK